MSFPTNVAITGLYSSRGKLSHENLEFVMSKTETAGEHSGVKVEERVIPVPVSISPEAQARLHEAVGSDGLP